VLFRQGYVKNAKSAARCRFFTAVEIPEASPSTELVEIFAWFGLSRHKQNAKKDCARRQPENKNRAAQCLADAWG
jgi:hypothetical protein